MAQHTQKEEKKPFPYQVVINITFGLAFIVLAYFTISLWQGPRIVYINTPKLVVGYKGMQDAQEELKGKKAIFQARVDTLVNELRQLEGNIKRYGKKMGKKELAEKEDLFNYKRQQLEEYGKRAGKSIEDENKKVRKMILEEINAFIIDYSKQRGYRYVLGANANGDLVYAAEGLDITDEVLKGLNKNYVKTGNK